MNSTDRILRQLKRRLHISGALLVLILTVMLGWLLLIPLREQCAQVRQQIDRNHQTLASGDAINRRCAHLSESLLQADHEITELTSRIPLSLQEAEFLNQLTRAGEVAEVRIFGFQPLETKALGRRRRTQIQLNANGTFAGACRLLFQIRRMERLCEIDHCHLLAGRDDEGRHTMTLTVSVFHTQLDQVAMKTEQTR